MKIFDWNWTQGNTSKSLVKNKHYLLKLRHYPFDPEDEKFAYEVGSPNKLSDGSLKFLDLHIRDGGYSGYEVVAFIEIDDEDNKR